MPSGQRDVDVSHGVAAMGMPHLNGADDQTVWHRKDALVEPDVVVGMDLRRFPSRYSEASPDLAGYQLSKTVWLLVSPLHRIGEKGLTRNRQILDRDQSNIIARYNPKALPCRTANGPQVAKRKSVRNQANSVKRN